MGTSKERGAAMVETAIVLPIIFLLCFGTIEYGYRFMKQSQLNNYAYIDARHRSIPPYTGSADIATKLSEATPPGATVPAPQPVTVCPEDPGGDDNAVVDIDVDWPSVTGLLGFLPGINGDGTVTYHARGVARCNG